MPIRIPIYEGHVPMSPEGPAALGGPLPVAQAAVSGLALSQAAQQMFNSVAPLYQVMRSQQDLVTANQKVREMDRAFLEVSKAAKEKENPDEWLPSFQEGIKEAEGKVLEGLKPNVAAYVQKHNTSVLFSYEKGLERDARERHRANFEANVPQALADAVTTINAAPDELVAARARSQFTGLVKDSLYLSPEKKALYLEKFDQEVRLSRVKLDIQRDAAGTYDRLAAPEKYYPELKPGEALSLRNPAHTEMVRKQQDNTLQVDQKFQAGQLSLEDLAGLRDRREINPGTYRMYEAALQAPEKKLDTQLQADMWVRAHQGQIKNDEEVYGAVRAGKLTTRQGDDILRTQAAAVGQGTLPDEMAFTKNQYFQWAKKNILWRLQPLDDNLMSRQINKISGGVREQPASSKAVFDLMQACQEAQKKGELTGDFIQKKTEEIIQPYLRLGAGMLLKGGKGGGAPAPPQDTGRMPALPGIETVTRGGRTYRVVIQNGRKMVDPNPLD